jgi:hypothetical protein
MLTTTMKHNTILMRVLTIALYALGMIDHCFSVLEGGFSIRSFSTSLVNSELTKHRIETPQP